MSHTMMQRWAGAVLIAGVLLSGCAQGREMVDSAAQDLQDRAASEAAQRIEDARGTLDESVRARLDDAVSQWDGEVDVGGICEVVRDRRLTPSERRSLELVAEYGVYLGLPGLLVEAARGVINLNDNATAEQVNVMIEACNALEARAIPEPVPTTGGN